MATPSGPVGLHDQVITRPFKYPKEDYWKTFEIRGREAAMSC